MYQCNYINFLCKHDLDIINHKLNVSYGIVPLADFIGNRLYKLVRHNCDIKLREVKEILFDRSLICIFYENHKSSLSFECATQLDNPTTVVHNPTNDLCNWSYLLSTTGHMTQAQGTCN